MFLKRKRVLILILTMLFIIKFLKNRIDCLSLTLSNCAFNHNRLKILFQKKQAPHVHAHHPPHAYAYSARHDHTHTHVHTRVYTCTHCDRKGHLARFCYDIVNSLNFANKNVWVPFDAKPRGLIRKR